ncbi:MAG TPA: RagB/SusD family nutrient uptake outer membrane protein [Gemmatirosa sp.]|nr:RagB/SusD family nutrient uptake outer membrane protein [Gemmatirosa sp.]
MTSFRTRTAALGLLASAALAGCSADRLNAPLETNTTPEGSANDPLRTLRLQAAGILATERNAQGAYIRDVALFGREAWYFQLQDSRWVTHYFRDFNDPTTFATGSWALRFDNLRNIKEFQKTVTSNTSALTAGQVAGANGFAQTERGIQVLYLVNSRFNLGTPVDVPEAATDAPLPFVSRDSAYSFVSGSFDAAYTSLTTSGAAFPFTLPTAGGTGYTGFTTPATYGRFNRALKARVEAYRGSLATGAERTARYQAANTALGLSFITDALTAANLNTGVYYLYSAGSGDVTNTIWGLRNDLFAHMSITTDASVPQTDTRVTSKLLTGQASRSQAGSEASTVRFNRYLTNDAPIPLIDNEELWLLRAEIQWFTGNQAAAVQTLNTIATVAGGAAANRYTGITTEAQFLDALLAERRLSLLLEGHRWVDLRRFGRLNTLPAGGTGFTVPVQQVVPAGECQARDRFISAGAPATIRGPGCL